MHLKNLGTYLNDHLAGSNTALELLEHLAKRFAGSDVEKFANTLRIEIAADRKELEALMARLEIGQSRAKQGAAWLMEKFVQLKLRVDDRAGGAFALFEAMEVISGGIEGKHMLWKFLMVIAEDLPELRGLDYQTLIGRAADQRMRAEAVRVEAGRTAMTDPGAPANPASPESH